MTLTLQPVLVATGEEGDGFLVFADGWLVAVLVRLAENHEENAGAWFLEKGFGALDGPEPPVFETLEIAQSWVAAQLRGRTPMSGRQSLT